MMAGKCNEWWLTAQTLPVPYTPPREVFLYTIQRQLGKGCLRPQSLVAGFVTRQLPGLLRETSYDLGRINKIFAAQWITDNQIIFGTKCNKIFVLDLKTSQIVQIPSLRSSVESSPAESPCGIHSIAINPSRTMLATGAIHTNDLAIYKLPTFDPICIGETGHTDWIFDIKWLDDEFLVTGSRDNYLALWHIPEDDGRRTRRLRSSFLHEYGITEPVLKMYCKKSEKIRALAHNSNKREVASLSLNAHIHLWDTETFTQKDGKGLKQYRENVCMDVSLDRNLYAVGSHSYVTLLDSRNLKATTPIASRERGCGIRSVSFNGDIVTIGTGSGMIYFYDLRGGKYLEMNCGHHLALEVGKGWLLRDETFQYYFSEHDHKNAIYSHCYDSSGTRLFAAGGPLQAGLHGNYAGLWH